ncbi:SprT-like domain-containing protein [Enterococcus sp. BWR-S5]|uniref:SprT-like domain-containing protein n=1 Tax=Enterococcus sp. BWR-S5 TaxID=2787714 RepID=UPI0019247D00|nr:SprT-like domain-containing protein [Enterococcus sp. BWR-S5]MBL1226490.1 SprT-like family protein [Enterococcus sp. BWR-S5]
MKERTALSEVVKMLEQGFDILNEKYFENALSKSVITVQSTPGSDGHFTQGKVWNLPEEQKAYEINVSAESLGNEIEHTVDTLIHEMVHQYCAENDIKDTSRGGTYHNKKFKAEVEKRGLIVTFDKKYGFGFTKPSEEVVEFVKSNEVFQKIALSRTATTKKKGEKKSSTRKYECPCCEQSVRATKEVKVICGECGVNMVCC